MQLKSNFVGVLYNVAFLKLQQILDTMRGTAYLWVAKK